MTIPDPQSALGLGPATPAPATPAPTKRDHVVRRLLRDPVAIASILTLVVITVMSFAAPLLTSASPMDPSLANSLGGPEPGHPLGFDGVGRDVWARLLYGGQVSLIGALIAVVVAVVIGVPTGLVAGYRKGAFDGVTSWIANLLMAMPGHPRPARGALLGGAGHEHRDGGLRCADGTRRVPPGARLGGRGPGGAVRRRGPRRGAHRRPHHAPAHPARRLGSHDHPGRADVRHRDHHPGRPAVPRHRLRAGGLLGRDAQRRVRQHLPQADAAPVARARDHDHRGRVRPARQLAAGPPRRHHRQGHPQGPPRGRSRRHRPPAAREGRRSRRRDRHHGRAGARRRRPPHGAQPHGRLPPVRRWGLHGRQRHLADRAQGRSARPRGRVRLRQDPDGVRRPRPPAARGEGGRRHHGVRRSEHRGPLEVRDEPPAGPEDRVHPAGADVQPRPLLPDRLPAHRAHAPAPRPLQGGSQGAGPGPAGPRSGIPDPERTYRRLPARGLGRHGPARAHRRRRLLRPGAADRRRADHGPRRHRPGRGPRPLRSLQAERQMGDDPRDPQLRRRRRHLRPDRGHAERARSSSWDPRGESSPHPSTRTRRCCWSRRSRTRTPHPVGRGVARASRRRSGGPVDEHHCCRRTAAGLRRRRRRVPRQGLAQAPVQGPQGRLPDDRPGRDPRSGRASPDRARPPSGRARPRAGARHGRGRSATDGTGHRPPRASERRGLSERHPGGLPGPVHVPEPGDDGRTASSPSRSWWPGASKAGRRRTGARPPRPRRAAGRRGGPPATRVLRRPAPADRDRPGPARATRS